ncbi:CubicO group peptidase (beta-lactamase class C family) [Kineosphaera limosa]|nr:serine hydrolase domain-containing protein [Kineosphaera limosa]NYE02749.1 CubicO group peptidase (beta-lactamase class C family) [Kineosphaera limosa]
MNDKVHELVRRHVEAGTLPGAVTLVARPGRDDGATGDELAQAVGVLSFEGRPMRPDAIMRIQSMTKAITTVATLLHVQAGRVGLDDPVQRWLPEMADRVVLREPDSDLDDTVPAIRPVTVRDLLTNASGYGIQTGQTPLATAMRAVGVEASAEPPGMASDAWLNALATLPLTHQPGAGFRYHHSFSILGILLSRVAGTGLDEHLRRSIFDPLEMRDTGLWVPTDRLDRLSAAYRFEDDALVETEPAGGGFYAGPPPFDVAHGELVSTAADLCRFLRLLTDGGRVAGRRLLEADLVAQMIRDQVPAQAKTPDSFFPGFWDGTGWGYGGSIQLDGPHKGRFGWAGGQGTDFLLDPDGTIAILLTQVELGERMWPVLEEFQAAV